MQGKITASRQRVDINDLIGTDPQQRAIFDDAMEAVEKADWIRRMRVTRHLDTQELARRLGVLPDFIVELEAVRRPDELSYSMIKRIALACEVEWPPRV